MDWIGNRNSYNSRMKEDRVVRILRDHKPRKNDNGKPKSRWRATQHIKSGANFVVKEESYTHNKRTSRLFRL